ncbi:MAG: hypothetical protein [Malazfec virus 5]
MDVRRKLVEKIARLEHYKECTNDTEEKKAVQKQIEALTELIRKEDKNGTR